MATIDRQIKRGDVRTFDESYNKGFKNIYASEVDADFDTLFDSWNHGSVNVADGAITNAKLADGSVTSSKLAPNSVNSSHIIDGAVAEIDLAVPVAKRLTPPYTAADQFKIMTVDAAGNLVWVTAPPATLVAGQVQTVHLADAPNSVTDAKITSVSWGKITGAPTSLPPGGPAGGDLVGTYPNPEIRPDSVGTPEIAAGAVSTIELADGSVTNVKVADVAWSKISGAPTALPPSGAAGGDLAGSYPNPVAQKASGDFDCKGANLYTGNNLWLGAGGMRGLVQGMGGADGRVMLTANCWTAPGDGGRSSWVLYMQPDGDALIGRRPPNTAAGTVTWHLYVRGSDGKTVCTLADSQITKQMVYPGNGIRNYWSATCPSAWVCSAKDAWVAYSAFIINTSGGICEFHIYPSMYFFTNASVPKGCYARLTMDNNPVYQTFWDPAPSGLTTPIPGFSGIFGPAAGSHTMCVWYYNQTNSAILSEPSANGSPGTIWITEYL